MVSGLHYDLIMAFKAVSYQKVNWMIPFEWKNYVKRCGVGSKWRELGNKQACFYMQMTALMANSVESLHWLEKIFREGVLDTKLKGECIYK